MLLVKGINVHYGTLQALWDVTISVEEGDRVALLGPNGAGKSTLLNTIAGVLHPTSGEIQFLCKRIDKLPAYEIAKMGISLVPETKAIFPYMTVMQNLLVGAQLHRGAWDKREETLEWVFSLFPRLKERKWQKAGSLSGGEMQMLNIGVALMSKPKLLLVDEPSLGLAPQLVITLYDALKRINEEGNVSLLLAEQHVHHALTLTHRGYVIENGRVVLEGNSEFLLNNKYIKEKYLGM
jgi:branched-chain amino acid transport system ATP-binding protein